MFALHIPRLASLGVAMVAELVIRYATVGDEVALHQTTVPVQVNLVSADEAAAAGPDAEVVEEVVILKAAQAQEEARKLADEGDFEGARGRLAMGAEDLRRIAPSSPRAEELLLHAEELEESEGAMAFGDYDPMVRKQMTYGAHRSRRSRPRP